MPSSSKKLRGKSQLESTTNPIFITHLPDVVSCVSRIILYCGAQDYTDSEFSPEGNSTLPQLTLGMEGALLLIFCAAKALAMQDNFVDP
jgi:hypothetical protein